MFYFLFVLNMDIVNNVTPSEAQVASKDSEKKSPKTKVFKNVDFKAIAEANRGFNLCPAEVKCNDVKKAFLLNAAEKLHDEQKFHGRYMGQAKMVYDALKDRKSVVDECEKKGIDLGVLSTHVVFLGQVKMNKVMKYGVGEQSPIYNILNLFSEPFIPADPQDFIDKSWKPSEHKDEVYSF